MSASTSGGLGATRAAVGAKGGSEDEREERAEA